MAILGFSFPRILDILVLFSKTEELRQFDQFSIFSKKKKRKKEKKESMSGQRNMVGSKLYIIKRKGNSCVICFLYSQFNLNFSKKKKKKNLNFTKVDLNYWEFLFIKKKYSFD